MTIRNHGVCEVSTLHELRMVLDNLIERAETHPDAVYFETPKGEIDKLNLLLIDRKLSDGSRATNLKVWS